MNPDSDAGPALDVRNLTQTYVSGERSLTVLNDVTFSVPPGQSCAVVGPSGSGKTTLLGLCAGLDRSSSGSVTLHNVPLDDLSEDDRASIRNQWVGFVFQDFQLIPTLTALENVSVPLELRNQRAPQKEAKTLLERVGLADRLDHYPAQLSGGEQQRVAIARAVISKPNLLLADEPTGNVDDRIAYRLVRLFEELHRSGTAVVVATHNDALVRRFSHPVLTLTDGILYPSIAPVDNGGCLGVDIGATNRPGQIKAEAAGGPVVRRKLG